MGPLSLTNPWVLLGIVLMMGAVGVWQRDEGKNAERVVALKDKNDALAKKNAELAEVNATILRLQKEIRELEARHQAEMDNLEAELKKEKADNAKRKKADADAARAGGLVLRVPASVCGGTDGDRGAAPALGSTASVRDGGATVELPRQVTADLFDLANDADAVADQLRACQQVVLKDRAAAPNQ
ncbi:MAG: prophage endopeptidase [Verrucomicrobiota bacterium]|nr:prophage endopeptidase [Verrucomicrobiota bacterium]